MRNNHIRNVLLMAMLLLAPLILPYAGEAWGQRVLRTLESNIDKRDIAGGDSIDQSKKEKKVVPTDVKAWTLDPLFGNRTPVDVDTLHHGFHSHQFTEGRYGEYAATGNIGGARESRIFMDRPDQHNFLMLTNMGQFVLPLKDWRFYNTKSPYVNLTYDWAGTKTTGYDNFQGIYTNNVNKRTNIGGLFQYVYGQGYYGYQSTAFLNSGAWASYVGDRYDFHFRYIHYDMKMKENGGITDEVYITNPESMSRKYDSDDIPTNLTKSRSRQHHDEILFNQRYHIGFTRTEGDSTNLHDVFVPVTSFFHTSEIGSYRRRYISADNQLDFYEHAYLHNDTTKDHHTQFHMKHTAGITLHEGFNKWAVAGLSAYVGFESRKYEMPDTVAGAAERTLTRTTYKENNVLLGGQLIRRQGTYVHYDANAELVVAGDDAGDLKLSGHGELNVPMNLFARRDTAQLAVDGSFTRTKGTLLLHHFHSNNVWWDKEPDAETRTRLFATLTVPRTMSKLQFGVENVSNYIYMKNTGAVATNSSGETFQSHAVGLSQANSVQVIMGRWYQDFRLGILNWENAVTFQKSTDEDVLPLPALSIYSNLYLKFTISKVLHTELGCDMKYFTKYYAPDYDPVTTHFILQNEATRTEIGGYPIFSAYVNFALKKLRFHLNYYHLNQSDGRYLSMPMYPFNPKGLRFGISWNFYD